MAMARTASAVASGMMQCRPKRTCASRIAGHEKVSGDQLAYSLQGGAPYNSYYIYIYIYVYHM